MRASADTIMSKAVFGNSIPKWIKYLGLAFAGCASFAIAVYFTSTGIEGSEPDRHNKRHKTRSVTPPKNPILDIHGEGKIIKIPEHNSDDTGHMSEDGSRNIHEDDVSARITVDVIQNPFGALNLNANIDVPSESVIQVEEKPSKKSKKALPTTVQENTQLPQMTPVAPALPFTIIGAIQGPRIGNGMPIAFLSQNGTTLVVKATDIIGAYRVEGITDKAIDFTYLPLKQKQSLPMPR